MDRKFYAIKGTGWEKEALKKIMDDFPDNYITDMGKREPYIQVKAGPCTDTHKTVKIAPAEGADLMLLLTDMAGNVREGFLPLLVTSRHIEVMNTGKSITYDIQLNYSTDF